MRRSSESAIALVMTLVMLSVITVVTVAFLALTQRERLAVAQSTQQGDAEFMAEAGAERAKAEIFTRYLAGNSNLNAVELLVSRNYIRTNGFIINDPVLSSQPANTTNVNYEYRTDGRPLLTEDEMIQNLANLYFDPRVPVFINTNVPGSPFVSNDFRFYLDLNRNARFETNGLYPIMDEKGGIGTNSMDFVGDPEWVGVLEHPHFPHSRTNRFIGRYAYIVLPAGKSEDVNHIHNQAKRLPSPPTLPATDPGYYRNQGVGPWELNLAAFLVDLNTNIWNPPGDPYLYRTNLPGGPTPLQSQGVAFRDATEIYNTRLGSYQNLASVDQLLNPNAVIDFGNDFIDQFTDGLLDNTGADNDGFNVLSRVQWPGSYNWTNFFTPHDFFDMFRVTNFSTRLHNLGFATSSYDRYTYYRMLAQLNMDSASELPRANIQQLHRKVGAVNRGEFVAEPAGKININYDNLDYPITDMVPWDTNKFFTNVANVLLGSVGLNVTNIPITNYNVTVHRMLQMAANIYDATSSNRFPSVFRPIISSNIVAGQPWFFISGYYYDDDARNVPAWLTNSHGMPMIIGAKKCIPNFNEYNAQTAVMVARKLELHRAETNRPPFQTNEMYIIGVSNFFGLEGWNSCTQTVQGPFDLQIANNVSIALTNSEGLRAVKGDQFSPLGRYTFWPGFAKPNTPNDPTSLPSFKVPLWTNTISMTNSVYRFLPTPHLEDISATNYFAQNSGFRTPNWHLSISNHLVYILSITNRILDFVQFPTLTNEVNLAKDLLGNPRVIQLEGIVAKCWDTNRPGPGPKTIYSTTEGIQAQLDISLGNPGIGQQEWSDFSFDTTDKDNGIASFRQFVFPQYNTNNTNLIQQAPFTPARKLVITANWEVNDPLVHYMEEHLKGITNNYSLEFVKPFTGEMATNQTLGRLNSRYEPWRGSPLKQPRPEDVNPSIKDPGITKSDNWDFPTNRFPGIGWLGRVHRGTPWQTIYLKAGVAPPNVWRQFSLDPASHPTNDWRLLDVFTTAIHPNASHGQLSINQTNFAAWSALLSALVVRSNVVTMDPNGKILETYVPVVIEPSSPQLIAIYEGIQRVREKQPDKTFRRLGDFLSVPELSENLPGGLPLGSPFLDRSGTEMPYPDWGVNDTAMECIPQLILSLVKVGDPRYVILAYGQSLRPAENSILTSGPFMGMCTNYQITGEFVTRSTFQIEGTAGQPRPVVKSFNILSAE
jgi:hypothetical protein